MQLVTNKKLEAFNKASSFLFFITVPTHNHIFNLDITDRATAVAITQLHVHYFGLVCSFPDCQDLAICAQPEDLNRTNKHNITKLRWRPPTILISFRTSMLNIEQIRRFQGLQKLGRHVVAMHNSLCF